MVLSFIVVVFLLAGMVKGMIGLGLPAVSMGLLTMLISPYQAAALLIVCASGTIHFFIR